MTEALYAFNKSPLITANNVENKADNKPNNNTIYISHFTFE